MIKAATLRGYAAFDRVFGSGRRIGGVTIGCMYALSRSERAALRVGYAVSHRRFAAVRRNRVRRLMREAVRFECAPLCDALVQTHASADIVMIFRPAQGLDVRTLTLQVVRTETATLFRRLVQTIAESSYA